MLSRVLRSIASTQLYYILLNTEIIYNFLGGSNHKQLIHIIKNNIDYLHIILKCKRLLHQIFNILLLHI